MGTRNLTIVKLDGKFKVAQYCQWDGYPDGQGKTVLDFLGRVDLDTFREKVRAAVFVSHTEIADLWRGVGADGSGLVSMEVSDKFKKRYPALHRDTGAQVLEMIYESENGFALYDDLKFAADSLFCEWAYVIDLDEGVLDVYKGFNKTPLTQKDRFYFLDTPEGCHDGYHPVKFAKGWLLSHLPGEKEFVTELDAIAEEDEG